MNETIILYGKNFGPNSILSNKYGNKEYVWYGPKSNQSVYEISNCEVLNHSTIKCLSAISRNNVSRTGFQWKVQIEDQLSDLSMNKDGKYGVPEIHDLSNHINT